MATSDTSRMDEVAKELLARSKAGEVNWEETGRKEIYRVVFPDVVLTISQQSNFEDGAQYELKLGGETGRTIDTVTAETGDSLFQVLAAIFDSAEAHVRDSGINKALEYLKRS